MDVIFHKRGIALFEWLSGQSHAELMSSENEESELCSPRIKATEQCTGEAQLTPTILP